MSDNIVKFPSENILRDNLPVEKCLNQAKITGLESVVVAGFTKEGKFFFSASENVSNETTLWLLKLSEKSLFDEI